ncbi:uncharacterized protein LOC134193227 isoform X2 [Corticium candelabrum]|uniref:uncharacterized protein LOC134193227 isoform X2 n=1 Tax=Corticium candelabrum TaxID=121492 RepID=UPI002E261E48|nr:uncharacterized protein LOC134193227 isoform X2 [Corticium candelabrum]
MKILWTTFPPSSEQLELWNCETMYLVEIESAKVCLAYPTLHGRREIVLAAFSRTPHCIKYISVHKTCVRLDFMMRMPFLATQTLQIQGLAREL